LKKAKNEVVVLELIKTEEKELKGVDKAMLNEIPGIDYIYLRKYQSMKGVKKKGFH